jgi:hypothetical protein
MQIFLTFAIVISSLICFTLFYIGSSSLQIGFSQPSTCEGMGAINTDITGINRSVKK